MGCAAPDRRAERLPDGVPTHPPDSHRLLPPALAPVGARGAGAARREGQEALRHWLAPGAAAGTCAGVGVGCGVLTCVLAWPCPLPLCSWNQVGDEGATALAKALETNKTLTALDLSYVLQAGRGRGQ